MLETPFRDWCRHNPRLDSVNYGLSNMDIDNIWHRYLDHNDKIGKRTINHILLIEEKSHGADLSFAQRDTMFLIHQALRDADGKKYWTARKDKVIVRFWGYFKLRYDGGTMQNSHNIWWNKKIITLDTLEKILLFELNPLTLQTRDDRRHHAARHFPLLEFQEADYVRQNLLPDI